MDKYEIIGRIGEGAHGIVLEGKHLQTGAVVALKKVSLKRLDDGIPVQMLREIKALQELNHENIVRLRDVFPHSAGLVLVFDFMVSDLSALIRDFETPLTMAQIKSYLQQLLYGVAHMHANSIMHRDLKPANLLISGKGQLKIADLGQARLFFDDERRPYSHQVATRWYRAPELLYGSRFYDQGVDMWAVGCILAEMFNNSPLFPGENDIEQLVCVFRLLGTPIEEKWPGMTSLPDYSKITFPKYDSVPFDEMVPDACEKAIGMISNLLVFDSSKRYSAERCLIDDFILSYPLPSKLTELPKPKPRPKKRPVNLDFDPTLPLENSLASVDDIFDF